MCDHDPDETGECAGAEHLYQACGRVPEAWSWLLSFITAGVLGVPPGLVTEEELLKMTLEVSQVEGDLAKLLREHQQG